MLGMIVGFDGAGVGPGYCGGNKHHEMVTRGTILKDFVLMKWALCR